MKIRLSILLIVLLSLMAFPAFAEDVIKFDFPEEYQGLWFCSDFQGDRALMEIASDDFYINGLSAISEFDRLNVMSFSTRESPVTYSMSTAYTEGDSASIVEVNLVFVLDDNDGLLLCSTYEEMVSENMSYQGTDFYNFARF